MPQSRKAKATFVKKIFAGMTFVLTGEFWWPDRPREKYSHVNVARWIGHHGGCVESHITDSTDYLVCTIEDYKNRVSHVKNALKIPRRCKIVTFDWLEDCMTIHKKRVSDKNFQLDKVYARVIRGTKEKGAIRERFAAECKEWQGLADPRLYQISWDPAGFKHRINLTRVTTKPNVRGQQKVEILTEVYTLYLFQSIATPRLYKFGAKFKQGRRPPVFWLECCFDKEYEGAFRDWCCFFKEKTGILWEQRLDNLLQEDHQFRYQPPTGGKPVGLLPRGRVPPQTSDTNSESGYYDGSEKEDWEGSGNEEGLKKSDVELKTQTGAEGGEDDE